MDRDVLEHVMRSVESCTMYVQVFGELRGDKVTQRSQLRKAFARLASMVHPDHAPEPLRERADLVFRALNALRHEADEAIARGAYAEVRATQAVDTGSYSEVSSKKETYRFRTEPFSSGDFSLLYRGRSASGPVIAKIALEPAYNTWLENEAKILMALTTAPTAVQPLRRYLPNLYDTFVMAHGGKHFRVNVTTEVPDLVSVADIIAAYPRGLEAPQAAWVARRIIAQSIAAQMLGLIQTGITPDHVLVDPYKHEPLHIGWTHALADPAKTGARVTHVVDRWRDIYPPEVFSKKTPDHRTDIYMAGATIVRLLGGSVSSRSLPNTVPDAMAKIVLSAIEQSPARRPQDGAQYLAEFTRVVRGIWGSVYRPLSMPVH